MPAMVLLFVRVYNYVSLASFIIRSDIHSWSEGNYKDVCLHDYSVVYFLRLWW